VVLTGLVLLPPIYVIWPQDQDAQIPLLISALFLGGALGYFVENGVILYLKGKTQAISVLQIPTPTRNDFLKSLQSERRLAHLRNADAISWLWEDY